MSLSIRGVWIPILSRDKVYKHWLFYFMPTNSPITNAGIAKQRSKIRPLVSLSIFRPRIAACLNSSVHAHRGAAEWSLVEWARLGERTAAHARPPWRNANMAMRFPDRVYCCNSAPLENTIIAIRAPRTNCTHSYIRYEYTGWTSGDFYDRPIQDLGVHFCTQYARGRGRDGRRWNGHCARVRALL